jgi:hypothetical protein
MPVSFSWTIEGGTDAAAAAATSAPGVAAGADAERDWALDPIDGDLDLDESMDARFNRGTEAIASDLNSEFNMWLGEWYLDRDEGFPWLDVLGTALDESKFRRLVEEHAALIPGAVQVQNYTLTRDEESRSFAVDFEVLCDTGQVISATIAASQGG